MDPAPSRDPITAPSWVRWLNQVYTAITGLLAQFGTLSSSLTTLTSTVSGNSSSIATINGQISALGTGWSTWTPSVTPGGSMTVSGYSISLAQYLRFGSIVYVSLWVNMTLGGTASNTLTFSAPVALTGTAMLLSAIVSLAGGGYVPAFAGISGSSLTLYLSGQGNFTLGATGVQISGFYRCGS